MGYRKGKLSLFVVSLLSLLLVGPTSFAISDWTLVDECTYAGCDGWFCITWGSSDDERFCWCTYCEDYSAAGAVYQVGQDPYLCGAVPDGNGVTSKCTRFPIQIKDVDLNDAPMEGPDKAAIDEIRRLKGLNTTNQVQTIAPTEVSTPIQQPTKPTWPIFRRATPVDR